MKKKKSADEFGTVCVCVSDNRVCKRHTKDKTWVCWCIRVVVVDVRMSAER